MLAKVYEYSIGEAQTPQPGEIGYNTMRYRRSDTVKRSGDFQSKQHDMILHTYTTKPVSLPMFYILRFQRYSPDKILKVKVTTSISKVKSK